MKSRLLAAACLCVMATTASAQFRIQIGRGQNSHGHGGIVQPPHIDHHDHVIRDSHGHVQGIQHHDVIHGGSPGIIPSTGGTHVDHHDHVIRDSHGHVVGRQHHDVLHNDWSHIVPNTIRGHATGQYYVQGNRYYYSPSAHQHVVAKPVVVAFGGFAQYSDLSGRLETLVNEMLLDLHYNYAHNPGFAETYREGYQLLDVAKFIHAAEHNNDREAIRSRLAGTDQLFHHIQNDVKGWTRIHRRQIGSRGIITKMDLTEATLHHLMNDVGVSESAQAPQPGPAPGQVVEQAPPPPAAPAQGAPQSYAPRSAPAQNYAPQRGAPTSAVPLGNSPPPPTVP